MDSSRDPLLPAGISLGSAIVRNGSVADIPDEELLRRAVTSARAGKYGARKHWRWVGVMDAFGLGSTYAHQLCRRFNLDPDEMVKR